MNKQDLQIETQLWQKVARYLPYLRWVPFLRMVAVCNNLAFGKVSEKSDIDLFIIAKEGRLFVVRIFTVLILQVLGVRLHGQKITGRFCLSFFIDDSVLNLSPIALENDYYLAYWTANLVPILDDGVSEEFLESNKSWLLPYFDHDYRFENDLSRRIERLSYLRRFLEWFLDGSLGDWLEGLLRRWQLRRARKKSQKIESNKIGIIVNEHMLKFHHFDQRPFYRQRWMELYGAQAHDAKGAVSVKLTKERFLKI